jgi:hypothetical protein
MAGLTAYSRALDFVIVAMAKLSEGKPVTAAKLMQKATTCKDYEKTIAALDEMNSKPTLEQALSVVAKAAAKKAKDKKKKKKAKASANLANKGVLTIAEVEVDDLGLSEEDLLDSGDSDVLPEIESDGDDMDLDDLSLDDEDSEDLELADGDEDLDMDTDEILLDDDTVLDSDDAISAEAEDSESEDDEDEDSEDDTEVDDDEETAEALGTDAPIKPGKDGAPAVSDTGERSDKVSKDGPPKVNEAARAKRMLANIQILERQASAIAKASKVSKVKKK